MDWAWKFKILEANALMWRGLGEGVPSLFSSEPYPPSGELSVQKFRLEALTFIHQHQFKEAESKLRQAESVCATSHYVACAEVISAWGGLEMERCLFFERQMTCSWKRMLSLV
jgi:hypothetical protein